MQCIFFIPFLLFSCYAQGMISVEINQKIIPTTDRFYNAIDKFEKNICANIKKLYSITLSSDISTESKKITIERITHFNHLLILIQKIPNEDTRIRLVRKLIKSNNNCVEQLVFLLDKKAKDAKNIHDIEKIKNSKTSLNLNNKILIFSIFIPLVQGFYIVKIHKII